MKLSNVELISMIQALDYAHSNLFKDAENESDPEEVQATEELMNEVSELLEKAENELNPVI